MNFNAPAKVTVLISVVFVVIGLLMGLGLLNFGFSAFYPVIIGYIVLLIGVVATGA